MINEIQRFIAQIAEGRHLSREDAARAFQIVMLGAATPAQVATLLTGLRMKGETVAEIAGAALALRARMETVAVPAGTIDVCGTGGDGSGMLNVSTAVALVVAACGVPVAKHGNKSVSSRSGSADVLHALGVNIQAGREQAEASLAEAGICFLFAPHYHKAMRHVAPVRTELGLRTIFNLLGPLINPAQPSRQLMGVYDRSLLAPMAQVLRELGGEQAWIVHGDGADELTLTGTSHVAELKDGVISLFEITPEEAGLPRCAPGDLRGGDPDTNAREMRLMLSGKPGPYRDVVLLNAAGALIVAQKAITLREGVALAAAAIDGGRALETLAALVRLSQ